MKLRSTDLVIATHDVVVNGTFVPAGTEGIIIRISAQRNEIVLVEFQEEGSSIVGEVLSTSLIKKRNSPSSLAGFFKWLKKLNTSPRPVEGPRTNDRASYT